MSVKLGAFLSENRHLRRAYWIFLKFEGDCPERAELIRCLWRFSRCPFMALMNPVIEYPADRRE
jgi:hypothetical protein